MWLIPDPQANYALSFPFALYDRATTCTHPGIQSSTTESSNITHIQSTLEVRGNKRSRLLHLSSGRKLPASTSLQHYHGRYGQKCSSTAFQSHRQSTARTHGITEINTLAP
ncbi:hypothetical protein FA13DRAFT_546780 [Coprinellus micaceus]|uniref:Uncharacterized protein n=1 Tax=Coprinellus micaceus TaxID=71717 RepID=A0A4Y7T8D8_COPMI|nr:hypothetical protein FA13DRAFT_546780 [Coprinellus micaceus]